ncbi:heme/hemin ABC transporter substrate-binding protein [Sphingobacterium lactis]|uniref:heme/hemin ABC transporter substrate-binding protein n=1 Tax=Sphingobacterium lactis TaxID=797291 RepID=UPI003F7D086B
MKRINPLFFLGIISLAICSCNISGKQDSGNIEVDSLRIVSLNGTVSEILCDAGLEKQLVGVDVSSTYPISLKDVPKVGHNKKIPVEAVLALNPNIIIGTKEVPEETVEQFRQAGMRVILVDQEYSIPGSRNMIKSLTDSLKLKEKGDSILKRFDQDIQLVQAFEAENPKPKVLFIYARGTGTMMVGGNNTQVAKMIQLAGGLNVAKDFEEYKPLTPESLVNYNPDVILLFSSGLSSLGDKNGFMEVQGVKQTRAGKEGKIINMDGQLLSGFSPRLPNAIKELHTKIHE